MLKDEFNQDDRKPDVKTYHIHIYYDVGRPSDKDAKNLAREIARRFPAYVGEVHEHDQPGGPHAQSNVAVYIDAQGFGEIVSWLQFNVRGLSALVHPKSGDVIKDHIDFGLWLGPRREGLLNDSYFAKKCAERAQKTPPPRI